LRDVTATVDSVPLIAASIMSKKLAEGTGSLVLDVKTGSGAFMQALADARKLARAMTDIGNGAGVKTVALITDMSQPLGQAAGNALEVRQAVEVLHGGGPADFRELVLVLGGWMLALAGKVRKPEDARRTLLERLANGGALEKFRAMVRAQGGDARVADRPDEFLPLAPVQREVPSPQAGFVAAFDTRAVGMVVVNLGAGRSRPEDGVDHGVGLMVRKKIGDAVKKGESLATAYCRTDAQFEQAARDYAKAVTVARRRPRPPKLVYEVLK
jgi:pyrimidine-nucleoside phosphorylase